MDEIEALCHRLKECAYWPGDFKIVDNACQKLREQQEEIVHLKAGLQVALEEVEAYQKEYPKAWATVEGD